MSHRSHFSFDPGFDPDTWLGSASQLHCALCSRACAVQPHAHTPLPDDRDSDDTKTHTHLKRRTSFPTSFYNTVSAQTLVRPCRHWLALPTLSFLLLVSSINFSVPASFISALPLHGLGGHKRLALSYHSAIAHRCVCDQAST